MELQFLNSARKYNVFLHGSEPIRKVESLSFSLLDSKQFTEDKEKLKSSYLFWKNCWSDTFVELGVQKDNFSDDFLNKEIGGLFLGEKPIGFLMYHFIDLQMAAYRDSRYFKNYPPHLVNTLEKLSGTTMIITYMTVDKHWRRKYTSYSIPELLISYAVLRFLESSAERILGYFRNEKGTHNIFYRHGGHPILKGEAAYNVEVDFAVIDRNKARLSTRGGCDQLARKKWKDYKQQKLGETYARYQLLKEENGASFTDPYERSLGQREFL